mgnify:CR=1 FL=1
MLLVMTGFIISWEAVFGRLPRSHIHGTMTGFIICWDISIREIAVSPIIQAGTASSLSLNKFVFLNAPIKITDLRLNITDWRSNNSYQSIFP